MQDCDVYLLDDVLAAVDAHVAAQLWERAICGPLLASTRAPCRTANNQLHDACKGMQAQAHAHGDQGCARCDKHALRRKDKPASYEPTVEGWVVRVEQPASLGGAYMRGTQNIHI